LTVAKAEFFALCHFILSTVPNKQSQLPAYFGKKLIPGQGLLRLGFGISKGVEKSTSKVLDWPNYVQNYNLLHK
jgi:hypothetical protein